MKKENWRDWVATIGGLGLSICAAVAVIDFNTFNWSNPNDKAKLAFVVAPAIFGWLVKFKSGNDVKPN